jgi:hypothetical protein
VSPETATVLACILGALGLALGVRHELRERREAKRIRQITDAALAEWAREVADKAIAEARKGWRAP